MSKRFWNWTLSQNGHQESRVLRISGPIAEESWFDDEITPALFAKELSTSSGDIEIWLNSPGGDVVAAAQIYNMLLEYPGNVRVNVDGIAASAASVIAMAASTVAMSPVSMMMIHNPATLAIGDEAELGRAIDMLAAVKESIINAYQTKTGMSRAKLSKLMDAETWMDARAAIDMGFADTLITGKHPNQPDDDPGDDPDGPEHPDEDEAAAPSTKQPRASTKPPEPAESAGGVVFSRHSSEQSLLNKITHNKAHTSSPSEALGRRLVDLYADLADTNH